MCGWHSLKIVFVSSRCGIDSNGLFYNNINMRRLGLNFEKAFCGQNANMDQKAMTGLLFEHMHLNYIYTLF